MQNEIIKLNNKIQELEREISDLKSGIHQTLEFLSKTFSDELEKVMENYRTELQKEVNEILFNYKQH